MANKNIYLKLIVCLVFQFCLGTELFAQSETKEDIRDNIEKYIENTESNSDYTDLYDQIDGLLNNPINLNTGNAEELSKIPLITPEIIQAIINHRKNYGNFTSIYEIQLVEGINMEYIKLILPFVTIKESFQLKKISTKDFWKNYKHEVIILSAQRLQNSEGYNTSDTNRNAYLGNPIRQVIRYKGVINPNVQINFNTEKDAGEQLNLNSIFYSGNIIYNGPDNGLRKIRIKYLAIGDYQAAFGQGLTFGSGLAFGKSPFVMNIMRTQSGLRPYRSFNENEFLRGIGTTLLIGKNLDLTSFYSSKKIDANTINDSIISDGFSSIVNSGYHRSMNELDKKDVIKRTIIGSHLTFHTSKLNIGFTAVNINYNQLLFNQNLKPYQFYNFTGTNISNFGTDYKWYVKNLILFGEISTDNISKKISATNGLIMSLDKNIDISILYRNFNVKTQPQISNALGEGTDNRNENGFYTGVSLIPFKNYKLNAYSDIYSSNWLRYQIDYPSKGKDMMVELQFNKRKSFNWYVRYRNEQKQKNESNTQIFNRLENNKRELLRFHLDYIISPKLNMRNRIEQVWYSMQYGSTKRGFSIFQDINYKPFLKLNIIARYMFFDTEDYNSRLYAYENDMLYTYSVPAFQNKGTRLFVLMKYKVSKNIDFWVRWSYTQYENVETIGSGQDLIKENKATDLKFQIRWAL